MTEPIVEPKPIETPPVETPPEPKGLAGSAFYKQKVDGLSTENSALKARAEAAEAAIAASKTNELAENNEYTALWEQEKELRIGAEDREKTTSKTFLNGLKSTAVKEQAIRAGIHDAALSVVGILARQEHPADRL